MKKYTYLFLVAIFLLGSFGSWPYAYYELLRWVVCVASAYTAYLSHKSDKECWAWVFGAVAILFNPIAPIYLARDTWQVFDLAAAVLCVVFPFTNHRRGK